MVARAFHDPPGLFANTRKMFGKEGIDIVMLLRGSTRLPGSSEAEATSPVAWHQSGGQM